LTESICGDAEQGAQVGKGWELALQSPKAEGPIHTSPGQIALSFIHILTDNFTFPEYEHTAFLWQQNN
jgi:hypothetical protein